MADSPYLVVPGSKFDLSKCTTDDTGEFKHKNDAKGEIKAQLKQLIKLQEVLYASAEHAVLIVLQAMDGGGKDGAVEHVFSGVNPQGCTVTSFKAPTPLELSHDFLWRIHNACPPRGMIGIFNRSHYESILVERVKKLVPDDTWRRRYDLINDFEKELALEGTTVIKFFLNISYKEQKKRMQARLADPRKNWKFSPDDLKERKRWDDYMEAYQDALSKCSTEHAPWYVVPADHKWFRNWVISDVIVKKLESLKLKFPPPLDGIEKIRVK